MPKKMTIKERHDKSKDFLEIISQSISERLSHDNIVQNQVAHYLNISDSVFSRKLRMDGDFFTVYELHNMAKFFHVSLEELFTGVSPDNAKAFIDTGLDNYSLDWLKENRDDKRILEVVNLVLGHKEIADLLFELIYIYSVENVSVLKKSKTKDFNKDLLKDSILKTISDEDVLMRYAITDSIGKILDMTRTEYSRLPNSVGSQLFEEEYHNRLMMIKKSFEDRKIQLEKQRDKERQREHEDFENEAMEYCESAETNDE